MKSPKLSGTNSHVTGASGAIPRSDNARMNKHARQYYAAIRNRKSDQDVMSISQNTGYAFEDILKIKQHLFLNFYDLDRKKPVQFDPDYDIAQTWQRLEVGKDNIREMDLILLKHELYEYNLMHEQGLAYTEAHAQAENKYNYRKYVKELDLKEGIK